MIEKAQNHHQAKILGRKTKTESLCGDVQSQEYRNISS